MHQTKKGTQWHFGMKAHIGVDAESGLVQTVFGTAANDNVNVNVNDATQVHALLHGREEVQSRASVSGDQASVRTHQGALPRPEEKHRTTHHLVFAVQHLGECQA
jgi:IS5 family transposase